MMRHILSALICLSMVLSMSICPAAYAENSSTPTRPAPWDHIISVACGDNFTIGLRSDGRVAYAGDNLSPEIQKIAEWEHIERIEVLEGHYAVGYKEDGGVRLVSITNYETDPQWNDTDVADWDSIRQVSICECYDCVGLRTDGTVVSVGTYEEAVKEWKDVVQLFFSGVTGLMGIRSDGTLYCTDLRNLAECWGLDEEYDSLESVQWGVVPDVAPEPYGIKRDGTLLGFWDGYKRLGYDEEFYEPEQPGWHDITDLYNTECAMYALRSDGRICCHSNLYLMESHYETYGCDPLMEVSTWTDVAEFCCNWGDLSPVARRKDGTVITLSGNSNAAEIGEWKNVKEIIGYGDGELFGLQEDGTVLCAGVSAEEADEIATWTDVKGLFAVPTGYSIEKRHLVALRNDGTVVGVGDNSAGQLDFDVTHDIDLKEKDLTETQNRHTASDTQDMETEKELPLLTEGTCGENLRWKLDESGCLTVSGTGEMDDFGDVFNKCGWDPVREKIKKVSIEGAETIGASAFSRCGNLEEIAFSEGLKGIGSNAFSECGSLTELHFPDGLEWIESKAFQNCTGLKELWFPDSLKTIQDAAFLGCEKLVKVTLTGDTELGTWSSGYCNVFERRAGLKSAGPIGSGCDFEFAWTDHIGGLINWWNLEKVMIPETVTAIDDCAFFGCRSLRSIQIPDSVRSIGYSAFSKCVNLVQVKLPKNLLKVSPYMFYGCENLTEINIPENTFLERGAFKGCTGLKKINMPGHVREEKISDMKEVFSGCSSLEEITLPEGIRKVPLFAFRDCTNLQTVTLPESLEHIDAAAFMDCPNLRYVYYHGDGDWKMTQAFPFLKNTLPERCGYFDAAVKIQVWE